MYTAKMMIVMRRDLHMRKGKIAAQAGHACVEAALFALWRENRLGEMEAGKGSVTLRPSDKKDTSLSRWFTDGVAKICVYVDSLEELLAVRDKAQAAGLFCAVIEDAGCTEFHGQPTVTCLAIEPADAETLAPITGTLPLY